MKRVITLSFVLASLNANGIQNTNINTILNKHYETSQTKIEEKLLKEIKQLKEKIKKLEENQNEMSDEFEDRLDNIETSTLVDKINFQFEFRTRVDNFYQEKVNKTKFHQTNVFSNRLRLDMRSKITDNMKFIGRLTMYKNWADSYPYPLSNMDPMQGRRPSDSKLYVERAYIDWKVSDGKIPLILTIGRQPSSDGPSHQFKDNTTRKATYSALSFDGAADGIVATFPLTKITNIEDMAIRIGYGKGYQKDRGNYYIGNENKIKDANVYGIFFESSVGVENSLFQISAVKVDNVVSLTQDKNQNPTNTNIGSFYLYTSMIEFTNFKDTKLDFFAHYAISKAKPNGKTPLQGIDTNGDNIPDTDYPMGLLTSTSGDKSTKTGRAYWIGARYTFTNKFLHNPKIGVEYNKGSKYWFSFTQGSNDVTNKLSTRGKAVEVYYIQPINRYSFIRIGGTFIKYDYTGSGYQSGAPQNISSDTNNIKKLKNIYLLFNVKY